MAKSTKNEEHITGAEKEQKRLFKYKRAGVVLSEDEVQSIKAGRKKLRADMKAQGIKSKKEFELTASSLGLYFDKSRWLALLLWFLGSKGGWILLGEGLSPRELLGCALMLSASVIAQIPVKKRG